VGDGPFFQNDGGWSWARVERSLYQRAVGYDYESVKIFMPAGRAKPAYAKYTEHVPPDVTACIYWSKNRMPDHWRDQQQIDHVLGKYIISDKPMSPEDWARERADVLDVAPGEISPGAARTIESAAFGDGREENHLQYGKALLDGSSPSLPKSGSPPKKAK
jgi:hypothetical protein